MSPDLIINIIEQGLIYSLVVFAVFLTSRIIKFDDLTVEGSFGLGGAITNLIPAFPFLSIPFALIGGAFCGLLTGIFHSRLKMNNLISGLVTTTALFSISLGIAGSNFTLQPEATIFHKIPSLYILSGIVLCVWIGISFLLRSEIGLLLRSVGCNPQMITNLGRSISKYKTLALIISNSLTALAGTLFVQWCGFFSITGNVGTLIIGLTGLILGEVICKDKKWSLICGAILYQTLFAFTLEIHLNPIWNNLIKAALIIVLIQIKPKNKLHKEN